jgi:hypothetical protein
MQAHGVVIGDGDKIHAPFQSRAVESLRVGIAFGAAEFLQNPL